jgi:hypothetical protein
MIYDLVRAAGSQPRPPNPAEIALICEIVEPERNGGYIMPDTIDSSYGAIKKLRKSHQIQKTRS